MATNTVNGKRYIGMSKHLLEVRRKKHFVDARCNLGGCRLFYRAIRKYGPEVFSWEVLSTWPDRTTAMSEEIRQIAQTKPEYNITSGGEGVPGVPRTKEWADKISASNRGKKRSLEVIAKIKSMDRSHHYKAVVCLNDGQRFESILAASKACGVSKNSISAVLSKAQHVCGGKWSFRYASEVAVGGHEAEMLEIQKRRYASKHRARNVRGVVCVSDGKTFESAASAARFYGLHKTTIFQICRLGTTTASGLVFRYADAEGPVIRSNRTDEQRARAKALVAAALARGQAKIKKPVLCLDNGKVFGSISEAARAHDLKMGALSVAIIRGQKCGGLKFERVAS